MNALRNKRFMSGEKAANLGGSAMSPMKESPKLQRTKSQFYSSVMEEISQLTDEISSLSMQNASANANCAKLERDLEAITSALNQNVDHLQSINEQLEVENAELEQDVKARKRVLADIQPLFEAAVRKGTVPEGVDGEFFKSYFGMGDTDFAKVTPASSLDKTIHSIVSTFHQFDGVQTNAQFLERLGQIQTEIERMKSPVACMSHLKREMALVKDKQDKRAAQDAAMMRSLAQKKDELEKQIRRNVVAKQRELSPVKSTRRVAASPISLH